MLYAIRVITNFATQFNRLALRAEDIFCSFFSVKCETILSVFETYKYPEYCDFVICHMPLIYIIVLSMWPKTSSLCYK